MDSFYLSSGDTGSDEYIGGGQNQEPAVAPGRIWLVECDPAALSASHAGLLLHANVVLYERTLGAAVAEALPTGIYAEPLPATAAAGPAVSPRARYFAADGWSVVQLVERRNGRGRLPQSVAAHPDGPGGNAAPGPRATAPGQIFTANGLAG